MDMIANWLGNTPDFAVPFALAALGLILTERAGVLALGAAVLRADDALRRDPRGDDLGRQRQERCRQSARRSGYSLYPRGAPLKAAALIAQGSARWSGR